MSSSSEYSSSSDDDDIPLHKPVFIKNNNNAVVKDINTTGSSPTPTMKQDTTALSLILESDRYNNKQESSEKNILNDLDPSPGSIDDKHEFELWEKRNINRINRQRNIDIEKQLKLENSLLTTRNP